MSEKGRAGLEGLEEGSSDVCPNCRRRPNPSSFSRDPVSPVFASEINPRIPRNNAMQVGIPLAGVCQRGKRQKGLESDWNRAQGN